MMAPSPTPYPPPARGGGTGERDMTSALDTPAFLFIWMCFPLLMCGMLIVFFLWGVRSGQFADQERARYLALDSGIPEEPPSRPPPSRGRSDIRSDDESVHCPLPRRGRAREGEDCG
ncbi:cbb3-type cytochrome oxidase assembly protein CcoS [Geomonas agri]|uniref:cbb3-type cytochrome oxidase assembly protein CcoS n=1 Tax=Geomonas agri TaxID=2873702 RepID=UPI00296FE988|nr:cbb3-type cytochrome oxidase assembly protein CcoS [Geomonas agri]